MLQGQQSDFVGTEGLLASWAVWTSLLEKSLLNPLETYTKGLSVESLDLLEPSKWNQQAKHEEL